MSAGELLSVLAASYDDVASARDNYESIRYFYYGAGRFAQFDAAILAKNERGRIRIDTTYEAGTRHESLKEIGWGMAAGAATAVFPEIGVWGAIAAGGGSGAAIAAIAAHIKTGMTQCDLQKLGDLLQQGPASLIIVCGADITSQVATMLSSPYTFSGLVLDASPDQIIEDVLEAEERVAQFARPVENRSAI